MAERQISHERRSTQSMYEAYIGGQSGSSNKGCISSRVDFRNGLSSYNMRSHEISAGSLSKWDLSNCGGVPLDYDQESGTLYVDGSDSHTLLIGATGSKKSRLVIMPTIRILASAGEAMIICDPKGELYRRTAGFLEDDGYNIHAIDLREPVKGDGWNILDVPYQLYLTGEIDKSCEYINDIANNLIPITSNDPFWDYSARNMFFGLALLLFRICKEKRQKSDLANMRSLLKLRSELFSSSSTERITKSSLWNFAKQEDLTRIRLQGIVVCPSDTMSCIISVFDQHMSCFSLQPQMVSLLAHSTFDLYHIGFDREAVFLIMPDEKSTYHQVITVFLKQIYEILIDNAYKNTSDYRFPTRVNFILDEFSALPKILDMPQMITASRSRNIRFVLVVQSKHQLRRHYQEETDTIMSNCTNWIFLTSRETELLRELSELSGETGSNRQPLISISRLQHLNKDAGECLVFCGRKYPYFAFLPDIGIYDQEQHVERPLLLRQTIFSGDDIYSCPDYFNQLVAESLVKPLIEANSSPIDINDLDAMIKKIDQQIAELEAEERKQKGGEES